MREWKVILTITPSGLSVQTEHLDEDKIIETLLEAFKIGLANVNPAEVQHTWNNFQNALNILKTGE